MLSFRTPNLDVAIKQWDDVTREDVWELLDFLQAHGDPTPAADRMLKHGKRAKYNYRVAA